MIASTDYMCAYSDQIRAFLPTTNYAVSGQDVDKVNPAGI